MKRPIEPRTPDHPLYVTPPPYIAPPRTFVDQRELSIAQQQRLATLTDGIAREATFAAERARRAGDAHAAALAKKAENLRKQAARKHAELAGLK